MLNTHQLGDLGELNEIHNPNATTPNEDMRGTRRSTIMGRIINVAIVNGTSNTIESHLEIEVIPADERPSAAPTEKAAPASNKPVERMTNNFAGIPNSMSDKHNDESQKFVYEKKLAKKQEKPEKVQQKAQDKQHDKAPKNEKSKKNN
jgi:hypothetical protein